MHGPLKGGSARCCLPATGCCRQSAARFSACIGLGTFCWGTERYARRRIDEPPDMGDPRRRRQRDGEHRGAFVIWLRRVPLVTAWGVCRRGPSRMGKRRPDPSCRRRIHVRRRVVRGHRRPVSVRQAEVGGVVATQGIHDLRGRRGFDLPAARWVRSTTLCPMAAARLRLRIP